MVSTVEPLIEEGQETNQVNMVIGVWLIDTSNEGQVEDKTKEVISIWMKKKLVGCVYTFVGKNKF